MEKQHGEALSHRLHAAPSRLIESFTPTPVAATLDATLRQTEPGTTVSRIAKLWLYGHWGSGRTTLTASIRERPADHAVGYYIISVVGRESLQGTR